MSIRFSLHSAALLFFVLAFPAFTMARIADALSGEVPAAQAEDVQVYAGHPLPEITVVAAPYDAAEEARVAAARVIARTARPA